MPLWLAPSPRPAPASRSWTRVRSHQRYWPALWWASRRRTRTSTALACWPAGLGKVGYSAFKAATEEKPPAEEPKEDLLKPADFEKRLRDVREARESDFCVSESRNARTPRSPSWGRTCRRAV